jgi:hypothetical protein
MFLSFLDFVQDPPLSVLISVLKLLFLFYTLVLCHAQVPILAVAGEIEKNL